MAKIYFCFRCEWRIIDKEKNEATKKEPILGISPRIGFFVKIQNTIRSQEIISKQTVILTKKRGKVHSRSSQKDSGNKAESDFIPFLNIMNEW